MNRISQKFLELKKAGKKALIVYLTAGDPDLATTESLVKTLAASGTDIVELGIPFSDPIADGPTIQAASQRALARGVTVEDALALARSLRKHISIPLVIMSYYNPLYKRGLENFARKAKKAGIDGVIIPDLIPEEADKWRRIALRQQLSPVFLASPTTPPERIRMIGKMTKGFLYYISLCGVTGSRKHISPHVARELEMVKKLVKVSVVSGFGISVPQHAREMSLWCDGVIIGSAFIDTIMRCKNRKDIIKKAELFSSKMREALDKTVK